MLGKLAGMVTGINASIIELRRITSRNHKASGNVLDAATIQSQGVAETCAAIEAIDRSAGKVVQGVETLAASSAKMQRPSAR